MTPAAIVQGILVYALLAWKSYQLSRAPHDRPLRCVVSVFACAGVAWPISVAYSLHLVPAGAPSLMFAQPAFLLGCVYSLDLFFVFSLLSPARARRHAAIRLAVLAAVIAGMAAAAMSVSSYTGMSGQTARGADIMYLLLNAGMAGFLADSWFWARRGIPHADRTGARALAVSSWGIALMTTGLLPLNADVTFRVFGATAPAVLGQAGALLVIPGILLFLAGLAFPVFADRARAFRTWRWHRRLYRDLSALWHLLHAMFPEGTLPTRLPSSRWAEAVTPWQARRRAVRRQLECRDGLVRISPYLQPSSENPGTPLAERIVAAAHSVDPAHLTSGRAVPIAVPAARVPSTDIAADAAELVVLSRAISAVQHSRVLPSATERLFYGVLVCACRLRFSSGFRGSE